MSCTVVNMPGLITANSAVIAPRSAEAFALRWRAARSAEAFALRWVEARFAEAFARRWVGARSAEAFARRWRGVRSAEGSAPRSPALQPSIVLAAIDRIEL